MIIGLSGWIHRWKSPPELRAAQYFVKTDDCPKMNQLFAGLYDLILCRITKMNFLAPAPGRTLQEIFQAKIPKIDPQDATEREKMIIGPELIAYLKWLIYTAAFKDPSAGERGVPNIKFFTDWVQEIFSKEQGYRKLLLEELQIWYAKHQPAKKRGRDSIEQDLPRLVPGNVITLDDWELENDDDDDAGRASGRAAGGDGGSGS